MSLLLRKTSGQPDALGEVGVERGGTDVAQGVAQLGRSLVLTAPVGVGELRLEGPARGGEEQLGAGHGDVPQPDQGNLRVTTDNIFD